MTPLPAIGDGLEPVRKIEFADTQPHANHFLNTCGQIPSKIDERPSRVERALTDDSLIMKNSSFNAPVSRRKFLAAAGTAMALPSFAPLSALGRGGKTAPSERVTLAVVGWGMQGPSNTDALLALPDCQVVAACDLDE